MTEIKTDKICEHIRKIRRAFYPHSHDEAAGANMATGRIIAAIIMNESKGELK